ncbi:methyltransferase domain-containing protein [Candidatus Woesebacteria bacterium]|nr:methyltransferase domain-containing protein [Candidatus Woesebacteria bacterium]
MAAHYDTYDYPTYWIGREYEHEAEVVALKAFLEKIPKIDTILEIGAGFGRLTPSYLFRARKIILSDPSSRLLAIARDTFGERKNVKFIQSSAENLPRMLSKESVDLIILVRVFHHLKDPNNFFDVSFRLLKKNGYLILEFANKEHLKATFKEFLRGNVTFPLDIFPKHVEGSRRRKKSSLPFLNFHPDIVKHELTERGFEIKEGRSVSNIRSTFFKKFLASDTLIVIERALQVPLYLISFGPSIFLLAQKKE